MTKIPEIRTHRLVLRPLMLDDAPDIAELISDWDVIRMLARPPFPYSIDDAHAYLERAIDFPWEFAISEPEMPWRLMGVIGITGHLGYWLGRRFWGQGFMTEAARALINVYFDHAKSSQIVSGVFADNPGSNGVLHKLGFVETGTSRQFCPARAQEVDHIDMALRRSAWQQRSAA